MEEMTNEIAETRPDWEATCKAAQAELETVKKDYQELRDYALKLQDLCNKQKAIIKSLADLI